MKPLRRVSLEEFAAAQARSDAFSQALKLARILEEQNANLGALRLGLQFLARDSFDEYARCVPLESTEVEDGSVHSSPSVVSSGDASGASGQSPLAEVIPFPTRELHSVHVKWHGLWDATRPEPA